jgi:hypothetical protein
MKLRDECPQFIQRFELSAEVAIISLQMKFIIELLSISLSDLDINQIESTVS